MKPTKRKLSLSRSTLRHLSLRTLHTVGGAISGERCTLPAQCIDEYTRTCTAVPCGTAGCTSNTQVACTNLSCNSGCC